MSKQEPQIIPHHTYDGISEYDNPTPAWWSWMFILTAAGAMVYGLIQFAGGDVVGPLGEYKAEVVENLRLQFAEIGELEPDAPTLMQYAQDERWVAFGQRVYATHCVSCHGVTGQGINGANLTDDNYIHVKKVEDIADVIANGRNAGAMPAWQNRLHPNDLVLVSSYVISLRGNNVPGRKAEGEIPPPWSAD